MFCFDLNNNDSDGDIQPIQPQVLFLIGQEIMCEALKLKKREKDRELELLSKVSGGDVTIP